MPPEKPIDRVLARLGTYKRQGGGYLAHCPAHDDKHPSLTVTEGADGTVLVKCQSQDCPFERIVAALGLNKRDFFPSRNGASSRLTKEDADAALTNRGLRLETIRHFGIKADVEKQAWKFQLTNGGPWKYKAFAPNADPKYWVDRGTKPGVYHLRPCEGAPEAWLVEGEPDTWVAWQAGLKAFSFTGGVGTLPAGAIDAVAKANIGVVHIAYDNDDAGREGAAKVAAALQHAGINCTVRDLRHEVPPKGDLTTLYNNLHGNDERFCKAVRTLPEIPNPAVEWGEIGNSVVSANSALESEEQEWPKLVPLDTPNLPVFPVHCLPEHLAQYVRELAETTQTPLALPGNLTLAVIATALQGKYEIAVSPDYREPLNLFLAVVLDPGTRKSEVFRHISHPLFQFEQELAEQEADRVTQRQTDRDLLLDRLRDATKKAARETSPEEREALADQAKSIAVELDRTPELHLPRLIVDDITPEKLASVLAEQQGRISLLSAEGNVFSVMAGRYSSKGEPNLEVYLKGHAGDPLVVDRVSGRRERIPKPTLTIGVAVQPMVLRGMIRNREFRGRGLVARFLFAIPRSRLGTRDVDPPLMSANTRLRYTENIEALLTLKPASDAAGPTPHILQLSHEAHRVRLHFARDVEAKLGAAGDLCTMTDWGGKIVGAAVRIAGLLHVAGNPEWPHKQMVDGDVMRSAIELARYFIEHAKAAYGEMGADAALEGARLLIDWLCRDPSRSQFSRRDAYNSHRAFFPKAVDVDPTLELLEEHGFIRPRAMQKPGKSGRPPSQVYEVNPCVPTQKTRNTQKPTSESAKRDCAPFAASTLEGNDETSLPVQPTEDPFPVDPSDQVVLDMVREYATNHPGCNGADIIEHLTPEVSRAKSEIAVRLVAREQLPWLPRREGWE